MVKKTKKVVASDEATFDDSKFDKDNELFQEPLSEEDKLEEAVEEKKKKKTRKEKLRYKGKYELLPERENYRQLRFYHRRFVYKYVPFITAAFAILFSFAAIQYNRLLAISAILIAAPGIFWGILGLLKIRRFAFFVVVTGLVLNVIAIIMAIVPLTQVMGQLGQIWTLIQQYLSSFGGN